MYIAVLFVELSAWLAIVNVDNNALPFPAPFCAANNLTPVKVYALASDKLTVGLFKFWYPKELLEVVFWATKNESKFIILEGIVNPPLNIGIVEADKSISLCWKFDIV